MEREGWRERDGERGMEREGWICGLTNTEELGQQIAIYFVRQTSTEK